MNAIKLEQVRDSIIGIKPVYTAEGNATEILLDDGSITVDRRGLKSVHKALARFYALDLRAQRLQVQPILQRQGIVPFYLGPERVFVPLKMRQAVTPNDNVYGYVDVRFLDEPQMVAKGRSKVQLTNGLELEIYSNAATAISSRHTGLRLLEFLDNTSEGDARERQIIDSVLLFLRCLNTIQTTIRRIEAKL